MTALQRCCRSTGHSAEEKPPQETYNHLIQTKVSGNNDSDHKHLSNFQSIESAKNHRGRMKRWAKQGRKQEGSKWKPVTEVSNLVELLFRRLSSANMMIVSGVVVGII
jgi:hypothetical protein